MFPAKKNNVPEQTKESGKPTGNTQDATAGEESNPLNPTYLSDEDEDWEKLYSDGPVGGLSQAEPFPYAKTGGALKNCFFATRESLGHAVAAGRSIFDAAGIVTNHIREEYNYHALHYRALQKRQQRERIQKDIIKEEKAEDRRRLEERLSQRRRQNLERLQRDKARAEEAEKRKKRSGNHTTGAMF